MAGIDELDRQNFFSGRFEVKDEDGEPHVFKVLIPNLPPDHHIMLSGRHEAVAEASLRLGDGVYSNSYSIYLGGVVSCSQDDFWSGRAHRAIVNHMAGIAAPLAVDIEDRWFGPEALDGCRSKEGAFDGFDEDG